MAPKIVDKDAKRIEILEAALEVFMEKGFDRASISNIAVAAGVGKGTVYEYFDNKEQIVELSYSYFMEKLEIGDLSDLVTLDIPASEKVRSAVKGMASIVLADDNESVVRVMIHLWVETQRVKDVRSFILENLKDLYAGFTEQLGELIDEGKKSGEFREEVDSRGVASVIIGALDGLMIQQATGGEGFVYEGAVRSLIDIVVNGLRK